MCNLKFATRRSRKYPQSVQIILFQAVEICPLEGDMMGFNVTSISPDYFAPDWMPSVMPIGFFAAFDAAVSCSVARRTGLAAWRQRPFASLCPPKGGTLPTHVAGPCGRPREIVPNSFTDAQQADVGCRVLWLRRGTRAWFPRCKSSEFYA